MKLSIIVPVYNEFLFIMEVIKRIQSVELPVDREIIIVDDYSTDGTREVLKTFTGSNLKVLYHEKNYGKGRAIRTAIEYVTGDFTVIQDADLEYQPKDFNKMLEPLLEGVADVVYGSRFGGEMHRVLYFWHFMGNNFLTLLSNMFSDLNLSDMETCYKMFRTPILKKLTLVSDDFCIEPEITAKVAKMKCRIFETSISYQGRTYEEGKKIGWRDGFKAFFAIIRFNLFDNTIPDNEIQFVTLDPLKQITWYNDYIFNKFKSYLGRRVMEVGAGTGNFTKYFFSSERVIALEIEQRFVDILKEKFGHIGYFSAHLNDVSENSLENFQQEKIDTIVCLNVLEHIEEDERILEKFRDCLTLDGKLILEVPCYSWLFNNLDVGVNHKRRYSRKEILDKMQKAGFEIVQIQSFNLMGIAGWFVNGTLLN